MRKQSGQRREKKETICARVDADLFQRIEKYTNQLKKERPGVHVDRSDAMRVLLYKGLDAVAEGNPS